MQWRRTENHPLIRQALRSCGREDLIGNGPNCLVRPEGRAPVGARSGNRGEVSGTTGGKGRGATGGKSRGAAVKKANGNPQGKKPAGGKFDRQKPLGKSSGGKFSTAGSTAKPTKKNGRK